MGASTNVPRASSQSSLKLLECAETQIWRDGRVGADDEFRRRLLELDGQRAGVEIGLERVAVRGGGEPAVQVAEGRVGAIAEKLGVHSHRHAIFSVNRYRIKSS